MSPYRPFAIVFGAATKSLQYSLPSSRWGELGGWGLGSGPQGGRIIGQGAFAGPPKRRPSRSEWLGAFGGVFPHQLTRYGHNRPLCFLALPREDL
jgi:hypothetical protein